MRIENNSSDIQPDSLPHYSKLLSTSNAEKEKILQKIFKKMEEEEEERKKERKKET